MPDTVKPLVETNQLLVEPLVAELTHIDAMTLPLAPSHAAGGVKVETPAHPRTPNTIGG